MMTDTQSEKGLLQLYARQTDRHCHLFGSLSEPKTGIIYSFGKKYKIICTNILGVPSLTHSLIPRKDGSTKGREEGWKEKKEDLKV